ncbi:hypothetical protein [Streptomyces daliensis]
MRLRPREDAPGLLALERRAPSRWTRRAHTVAAGVVALGFLFVPSAVANPFCYIPMVCETKEAIDFASDPLGFLLQALTEANIWFLRKMLELIQNTTEIDLTSSTFIKQYALIFAASSLFTVALWLIAVAKRAVRGVGVTTAVGEAVGFLLLQFVVNAMTPGAIALLMKAIDEVTAIFEPYATANFTPFLENLLKIMAANPQVGAGQLLAVNLIMLAGALLMWIELLIRSAAIYVAVALGPLVNAGLVDRDLWGKSRKWFGAIFAIGLSKPVLFALLGLGGAILSDSSGNMSDAVSKTLVGALILLLAVFASATLYKWLPAFGDEMSQLHHDRKTGQSAGPASVIDGPGQHANRAMSMHVQDALVGGGGGGGGGKAAGGKASAAAGGKAASSTVGGGTAAAGPMGAAATGAKTGVDVAKKKAAEAPGARGTGAADGGTGQGQPQQGGDGAAEPGAPASARPQGPTSGPIVGSGPRPGPPTGGGPGADAAPEGPAPAPPPSAPGSGPAASAPPPSRPTGDLPGRPDPSKDQ